MRFLIFFGRFLSGCIALASGVVTLVFNDAVFMLLDKASEFQRYALISGSILIGIVILGTTLYDAVVSCKKSFQTHCLKYQSKKFVSFFTKWYGKPGKLSIICDDLEWIRTVKNDSIYNQLMKKSKEKHLRLYLGNGFGSGIAEELKSIGAEVFSAPQSIIQNHTFSCLSVMGNTASRVIVRTKQNDQGDYVVFDEINNTYVTELLNTLLKTVDG